LTPALAESLLTVAVKAFVCPWSIVWAALGETATAIAGGVLFPSHPERTAASTTPSTTMQSSKNLLMTGSSPRIHLS
jgi:hypothetical protein